MTRRNSLLDKPLENFLKKQRDVPLSRESLLSASLQQDDGLRLKRYLNKSVINPALDEAEKRVMRIGRIGIIVIVILIALTFFIRRWK